MVKWFSKSCLLLAGAMATGCAGAPRATVAFARPNVLMSNYRDVNVLATRMAGRSEWPSVSTGYVFDDVTYFSTVSVDDQAFYDQEGGGHYRSTESVQTGVRVR